MVVVVEDGLVRCATKTLIIDGAQRQLGPLLHWNCGWRSPGMGPVRKERKLRLSSLGAYTTDGLHFVQSNEANREPTGSNPIGNPIGNPISNNPIT